MLSTQENAELTQVGPGTPMGDLMRRYWHPIAATAELDERPTKAVRLMGEDLVLYRDKSGTLGLIERACPHRRVDLSYGIPEEHGLRCMYHGWMMDETGQCIEQPFEETVHPDGRFKEKVKIAGYPVQEMAGLVFAYMGPQPTPCCRAGSTCCGTTPSATSRSRRSPATGCSARRIRSTRFTSNGFTRTWARTATRIASPFPNRVHPGST